MKYLIFALIVIAFCLNGSLAQDSQEKKDFCYNPCVAIVCSAFQQNSTQYAKCNLDLSSLKNKQCILQNCYNDGTDPRCVAMCGLIQYQSMQICIKTRKSQYKPK